MTLADLTALAILVSLIFYALTAGADFGGGLWELFARGPTAAAQRTLIERAIAPVWEANHVWMILVIVLLFTGFPSAFSAFTIALNIPLTAMLIGIVLRGSAFTFRHYDIGSDLSRRRWGRIFSLSSALTPLFLGIIIGAVTSGALTAGHTGAIGFESVGPKGGFIHPWLAPFPIAIGLFALALFSFLAAVYLTVEAATDEALAETFRRRALVAGALVFVCAAGSAIAAHSSTIPFAQRLFHSSLTWPLQSITGAVSAGALTALWYRRARLARLFAIAQVSLILIGWGLAQQPYLIAPDLTIEGAAAPAATLRLLLGALAAGSLTLFPSLYWLFRIFKTTGEP